MWACITEEGAAQMRGPFEVIEIERYKRLLIQTPDYYLINLSQISSSEKMVPGIRSASSHSVL